MGKYSLLFLLVLALNAVGQTRNSVKSKEYPLPMSFDVVGHGVEMPPLEFHYDLESSNGHQLVLGNLKVDPQSFYISVLPATRLNSHFPKLLPAESSKDWVFLFQWPDKIMSTGVLEMISRTGRVIWSTPINDKTTDQWQNQLEAWRQTLLQARVSRDEIAKHPLFKIQFGMRNAQKETPFWNLQEPFRFCFSHVEESGQTRLCTAHFEVQKQKELVKLTPFPLSEAPPRVIMMSEDAKLANTVAVDLDKPFQFYAELRSGYSYEFVALPRKVNVVDLIQDPSNAQQAFITTEGDMPPLADAVLLNKQKTPEWVEWVGWQQTIGDFRKFWRTKVPVKETFLMVPGTGGGAFRQKFTIAKLPREEARPYLHAKTIKGTYVDGAPIRGRKLSSINVTSKQNSVENSQETKEDFLWKFGAKNRGDSNRSYLMVKDGENSFPAYHELYKGFAGEISSRLSGIVGAEGDANRLKLTIMGELAFNYWFESLLGWENPLLSRQRWGTSFKAFRSLTDLEISNQKAALQAYTGELKYRLNQGLWGRDETWGVIGGYQHVTYDQFNAQMAGVGAFWARSMPKVFDDMFDKFDLFGLLNYPKWVDMEFIFYPVSLKQDTVLNRRGNGNWALNFHGQVMFTKSFFGEAGFGLKQYDFGLAKAISSRSPNFTFTSSYGTVGLGFKF